MYLVLWNDENENLCKAECRITSALIATIETVQSEGFADSLKVYSAMEININDFLRIYKSK